MPVIVLNKADLCLDVEARIAEVETVAYDIPVCAVSATARTGLEALRNYLTAGITAALLGQSGVGKSAIINALLGEERQATWEVRENDRRGRHTTTRRQLILLPGGGSIIDSPGIREIQVWGDEQNLDDTFEDISEIAAGCRFSDCRHNTEPGCAVQSAIARGEIDEGRLKNYRKLQREMSHLTMRQKGLAALEEKKRWKQISQFQKRLQKNGLLTLNDGADSANWGNKADIGFCMWRDVGNGPTLLHIDKVKDHETMGKPTLCEMHHDAVFNRFSVGRIGYDILGDEA